MEPLQARLARGDPNAFASLYDACADRVGHYLLVRLGSRADAEDALQETFCRLVRLREKLANVENLEAYVITVARNEAARFTGATLDRLTHRCHILEATGESYRLEDARRRQRRDKSDTKLRAKKGKNQYALIVGDTLQRPCETFGRGLTGR